MTTENVAPTNESVVASLKEVLAEWTSWQPAAWHLGVLVGMWSSEGGFLKHLEHNGAMWWSRAAEPNALFESLCALHMAGVLRKRINPDSQDYEFLWKGELLNSRA